MNKSKFIAGELYTTNPELHSLDSKGQIYKYLWEGNSGISVGIFETEKGQQVPLYYMNLIPTTKPEPKYMDTVIAYNDFFDKSNKVFGSYIAKADTGDTNDIQHVVKINKCGSIQMFGYVEKTNVHKVSIDGKDTYYVDENVINRIKDILGGNYERICKG